MIKRLLLLCLLFAATKNHAQTNLYVDSSVVISGGGTSWAFAYKTLNEALNVVNAANLTSKYVVNIAKGTYYPTGIQAGLNRDSAFQIGRGGIKLYGGFPSGGGTRNVTTNVTTLSGSIGAALSNTDNSYHVMVIGNNGIGITATADSVIIDGFGFTGGYALGGGGVYGGISAGGAIFEYNVMGALTIQNCNFYNNTATSGGALGTQYVGGGTSILNSTFSNNSATIGGGICISTVSNSIYTSLTIGSSTFLNNTATSFGGAISCNVASSSLTIGNSTFTSNNGARGGAIYSVGNNALGSITSCIFTSNTATSATGSGGAIYTTINAGDFTSCTFTGNTVASGVGNGGAISGGGFGSVGNIVSCTFTGNSTTTAGYGGAVYGQSVASVSNSTFTGNSSGGGGALCVFSGSPTCSNSSFTNNTAISGGAIYAGAITLHKCNVSNNSSSNAGGGIYCSDTLKMDSSIISFNKASLSGGGLYNPNTGNSITYCTFTNDSASYGGGIYGNNNSAYRYNNISSNKANVGGGMYMIGATTNVSRAMLCDTISGNSATRNGGGIFSLSNSGSVNYCLFSGNKAGNFGGAVFDSTSSGVFLYCTFAGDTATKGNAMYNSASSSPTISNSIVWDGATNGIYNAGSNTATIHYCIVQGGDTGVNNLSSDPLFVHPLAATAAPTTGGDYQLMNCSPAINSSNGMVVGNDDLARRNNQFNNSVQDRGAYEYSGSGTGLPINDVLQTGAQLTAVASTVNYQWIDCGSGMSAIPNETAQTFTATRNGSYAVILTTSSGCVDTSACKTVIGVGVHPMTSPKDQINIFPNPVSGDLTITTGTLDIKSILLMDITGKRLQQIACKSTIQTINMAKFGPGVYFIEFFDGKEKYIKQINVVH